MTEPANVPDDVLRDIVGRALAEDVDERGDVTSLATIPVGERGRAQFVARADGILAGTAVAQEVFRQVDPSVKVEWCHADGDRVHPQTVIGDVEGPLAAILTAERTALNLLSHCSGIATATRAFVDVAAGRTVIRDTRKTTPGLRALEKAAVRAGGGTNHRSSLSEAVMIKDNHLAVTPIADAVALARAAWPDLVIEVECDSLEQVAEARDAGVDVVLLDNMTPAQVEAALVLLDGRARSEVSGGVTLATLDRYAALRPDFVSVGAITHSAPILDIALDFD